VLSVLRSLVSEAVHAEQHVRDAVFLLAGVAHEEGLLIVRALSAISSVVHQKLYILDVGVVRRCILYEFSMLGHFGYFSLMEMIEDVLLITN
jgi:hypothetical protein